MEFLLTGIINRNEVTAFHCMLIGMYSLCVRLIRGHLLVDPEVKEEREGERGKRPPPHNQDVHVG